MDSGAQRLKVLAWLAWGLSVVSFVAGVAPMFVNAGGPNIESQLVADDRRNRMGPKWTE